MANSGRGRLNSISTVELSIAETDSTSTEKPSMLLPVSGSIARRYVVTTASASTGPPLWNVAPSRIVTVTEPLSPAISQELARLGEALRSES